MDIVRHETGPRMSQANTHNGVVYLAGQVGEGTTVAEQTQSILAKIDRLLALSNSSKERILSAQIWMSDMAEFDQMNPAWEAWMPAGHAPARATGEAKLASPQLKVEIIIIAAQNA